MRIIVSVLSFWSRIGFWIGFVIVTTVGRNDSPGLDFRIQCRAQRHCRTWEGLLPAFHDHFGDDVCAGNQAADFVGSISRRGGDDFVRIQDAILIFIHKHFPASEHRFKAVVPNLIIVEIVEQEAVDNAGLQIGHCRSSFFVAGAIRRDGVEGVTAMRGRAFVHG